jgi:membrane-associated phospholipid phosphatase
MTAAIAAGRRLLPRGYADLARQTVIWVGFYWAYQLARAFADRNPAHAFSNGLRVIDIEQRTTGLFELTAQQFVDSSNFLMTAAAWTYWNSEFPVLGLSLLWVYLRRHDAFARFRNTILVANLIGLVGYIFLPTAPPRMFPGLGFVDSLDSIGGISHSSGAIGLLANPYAAMPSLHAADALIVGLVLASVVRNRYGKVLWLLWPVWVWFCVCATANHFFLDVLAGIVVAVVAILLVPRIERRLYRKPAIVEA